MKIVIISGSPRGNSITYRVALHLQGYIASKTEHEVEIIDLREVEMPQLQAIFTSVEGTPEEFRQVSAQMFSADAFILVTPEYNGSYSAAMKNLLDHYPKQHHKVFGIVTASPGALGGVRAALQLQELVYALFGIGSPYMLVTPHVEKKFDAAGNLIDEQFKKAVEIFIKEFLWLSEKLVEETISEPK